ncbi:MAG: 30S ribosomal protein S1 [Deltaproteobacteria bacterium]|nr:30S ribosomal protein S1 [Deltaproteobacteria bacterium]MBW2151492.1 30S ribosomal protein S1 [Deltaproteobacteria bacterium]
MSENLENNQHQNPETTETQDDSESFAELLESYEAGMREDLNVGDRIRGKIIAMDATSVFIDTGTKIDGVAHKEELLDENGRFPYSPGDQVELYVVAINEREIRLSRAISGIGGLSMLREAFQSQIPVEGKVRAIVKGGFQVEVLRRSAFCPMGQMDIKYIETPEDYVGNTYQFLIKQFEENGRNIVLSRREKLEAEQKEAQEAFLKELTVGAIVEGRVTRLMRYGAFVELIAGLEGMVHISELSWSRLLKPQEAVKIGDTVRARVLSIEGGQKEGVTKIALSVKQVSEDPWNTVADTIRSGDRLKGRVTRCTGFGAFVEVLPGIEGLVHISEMSYVKRVNKPQDLVSPGDTVWVVVKEVDAASRRISLSIKDAEGDPWQDIDEKYSVGQVVNGTFENKEAFGYFITLEPGITGLLPKSKVTRTSNTGSLEKLKQGDPISVIIDEIHRESRRISLGLSDAVEEENWRSFAADSGKSLGSLGEQLQKALQKKERQLASKK